LFFALVFVFSQVLLILRGILGWVLGRRAAHIVPIEDAPVTPIADLTLNGVFSGFSGIVAEGSLGNPPQRIRLGFDFTSDSSTLFTPGRGCPPYVGACFDPSASTDPPGATSVRIGLTHLGTMGFNFADSVVRGTPSEVAGFLGAGPDSSVFAGRILAINDFSDTALGGPRIAEIHESGLQGAATVLTVPGASSWTVPGVVWFRYNPLTNVERIEYDPSEHDLVLSDVHRQLIMLRVGTPVAVNSEGRLVGPCSDFSLNVHILFGGSNDRIAIPSAMFLHEVQVVGCSYRIRFDRSLPASVIVVGRILTKSVVQLHLDYSRKAIRYNWYNPMSIFQRRPFRSPTPLVPVFNQPQFAGILPDGLTRIILSSTVDSEAERSLVLMSLQERPMVFGSRIGSGYVFAKLKPVGQSASVIRSGCNLGPPIIDGSDRISFRVHSYGVYDLWIISSLKNVGIMKVPSHPTAVTVLRTLDLPDPTTRSESDNEEECPICLEPVTVGELEQEVRPCGHKFHHRCIYQWIDKPSIVTCPKCRAKIPSSLPHELYIS
jgi:hypothetical protein